jgi:hypothetical protein
MAESIDLGESFLPAHSGVRTHEAFGGLACQLVARVVEPAAERLVHIEDRMRRAIQDQDAVGALLHERPEQMERVVAKPTIGGAKSRTTVA